MGLLYHEENTVDLMTDTGLMGSRPIEFPTKVTIFLYEEKVSSSC